MTKKIVIAFGCAAACLAAFFSLAAASTQSAATTRPAFVAYEVTGCLENGLSVTYGDGDGDMRQVSDVSPWYSIVPYADGAVYTILAQTTSPSACELSVQIMAMTEIQAKALEDRGSDPSKWGLFLVSIPAAKTSTSYAPFGVVSATWRSPDASDAQ